MHKNQLEEHKSTEGMVDYDRNSSAQQSIILSQDDQIRNLAERVGRAEPEMRIVDYGCGPGRSAISAVKPAVEAYRLNVPDGPVVVCHADQPGNDWNSLFGLVFGESGYHAGIDGVRTEASIGSFYNQIADEKSVDIGTCFVASHWLSKAYSIHAPGTLWFADLVGEARQRMAEYARQDWKRFLKHRADELKSGGYLFVSTLGSVPDSSEINGAAASGRGIYRAIQAIAQQMADDGIIKTEILDNFVFSLWFQTVEEARYPIETDDYLSSSFDVERIDVRPAPDNPDDFFGELVSDPKAYGDAYTGYIRAFADSTLRTQLLGPSANSRKQEDDLATEFYNRLNELYCSHRAEFAFELWHLTIVLKRI